LDREKEYFKMIDKKNIGNLEGESPVYDENYNKKQFKSKTQADIIKSIVEIIKNGVDAYIEEKGENCKSEQIDISFDTKDKSLKIINYAKGMDIETFKKALRIGGDTGSTNENKTGAHGYGMKEASWAFEFAKIITINNGKYSSRIFYWNNKGFPQYAWEKDNDGKEIKDFPLTSKIKAETGIKEEGTYFEGIIPEEIRAPTFDTLWKELSWHVLLRSINQSSKFDIRLKDISNKKTFSRSVKYILPEIFRLRDDKDYVKKGEFNFEYPKYGKITCEYEIYLAKHELNPFGDSKEAGILICAGPFSVLDCTLFNHGSKIAHRFFGKAILKGPIRQISKKERILDDRRISGLMRNTPIYEGLAKQFNPLLEELIEKERKRLNKQMKEIEKEIIQNKDKLLKALNKIAKNDDKSDSKGDDKFNPGEDGIRFCISGNYEKLVESQKKNIHLIVDTSKIPLNSEISIEVDKSGLEVNPSKIKVLKKNVDKKGIFKEKISFCSSLCEDFCAEAFVAGMINKAKINFEVIKDEMLSILNPLEFFPNKQEIVMGKTKKICLIMDKSRIQKETKLEILSDEYFSVNKKVGLKEANQIKNSIYELLIPVHCSGKPGEKGTIKAKIGEEEAIINLEIIKSQDRFLKGPFENIKEDDEKGPLETGYFEDKTIFVCVNHPIFKHYHKEEGKEKTQNYRLIYADTIVREAIKELTRRKVKIFQNTTAEEFRVRFDGYFNELYKKHSVELHKFCIDPENLEIFKEDFEEV